MIHVNSLSALIVVHSHHSYFFKKIDLPNEFYNFCSPRKKSNLRTAKLKAWNIFEFVKKCLKVLKFFLLYFMDIF